MSVVKDSYIFPASFTPEKQKELFEEIALIYDLTENVLAAVQRESNPARLQELELINPFVTQVVSSANILTGFYTAVVRKGHEVTPEIKETMESAFRTFYIALKDLIEGMQKKLPVQKAQS